MRNKVLQPDSVHEGYKEARELRAAPLALRSGIEAIRRDAKKTKRWIWPRAGEDVPLEWAPGYNPYEKRVQGLKIDNIFAECMKANAARPFSRYDLVHDGFPSTTRAFLNGDGSGVDGLGGDMTSFYRTVYEMKLYAGVHFARIAINNGTPVWIHVDADDLLDVSWGMESGAFVVYSANISFDAGARRLVFNTTDGVVTSEVYFDKDGASRDVSVKGNWVLEGETQRTEFSSVPLFSFQADSRVRFESDPPFLDAALAQMQLIRTKSLKDAHRDAAVAQANLVISGWNGAVKKTAEGGVGNPQPIPVRSSGVMAFQEDVKVRWETMSAANVEIVAADLERDEATLRRQCLDPIRNRIEGDVRATEMILAEGRGLSYGRQLVREDLHELTRLARETARILSVGGAPESSQVTMPEEFWHEGDQDVVDTVAKWHSDGKVSRRFFLLVAQANNPGIPEELWKEELARADREPTQNGPPQAVGLTEKDDDLET